jgi:hypothetical protein
MNCSVCGEDIGGRGDHCQNNGLPWHNKTHKIRYQRTKWGGPLNYWKWAWPGTILFEISVAAFRMFDQ